MAIDPVKNAIAWTGLSAAGRDYLSTGGYAGEDFAAPLEPFAPSIQPGVFGDAADFAFQEEDPFVGGYAAAEPLFPSAGDGPTATIFGDTLFAEDAAFGYAPGAATPPSEQSYYIKSVFDNA